MSLSLRTSSAIRLLAALPHQLGYTPRDSVVILPVAGRETRGILRMDLPSPDDIDAVAGIAVANARRVPDADAAIVVVFTSGDALDAEGVAHGTLVNAIRRRADDEGLAVPGELCVARDGWTSYADPDVRPLADISGEREPGPEAARSQADGIDVPHSGAADRERVAALIGLLDALPTDPYRRRLSSARVFTGDDALDADLRALDADPHGIFEEAVGDAVPTPERAALWMWILRAPALRDVALTQWAGGAGEARTTLTWQDAWNAGTSDVPDFPVRLAGEGPRPEMSRLDRARETVRGLAARAPLTHLPVCFAVCAWLSWALGNSTHAAEYARRALELEPGYTLPGLVHGLTDAGVLPGWAYDPDGAPLVPPWVLAQV